MGDAATFVLRADEEYDLLELSDVDLSGQDGSGSRFLECTLTDCTVDDLHLDGSRWIDGRLVRVHGGQVRAPSSTWRDAMLEDCRIGALGLAGADLTRVTVRAGKLDYLDLRDAQVVEMTLQGCTVGDLDLIGATVRRLRVVGCRVGRLDVTRAHLRDVDLRAAELRAVDGVAGLGGATISEDQLTDLAPLLAAHLGIRVG